MLARRASASAHTTRRFRRRFTGVSSSVALVAAEQRPKLVEGDVGALHTAALIELEDAEATHVRHEATVLVARQKEDRFLAGCDAGHVGHTQRDVADSAALDVHFHRLAGGALALHDLTD